MDGRQLAGSLRLLGMAPEANGGGHLVIGQLIVDQEANTRLQYWPIRLGSPAWAVNRANRTVHFED